VTADTVAEKLALVALAATVTDAGTATKELLLMRLTVSPPLGAAPLNDTVQASVPAPDIEALAQESALKVAGPVPVPDRLTTIEPPVVALLAMTNCPEMAPAVVGAN